MRPRLLTLTIVFAGLILLSRSVSAATLCVVPDFFPSVASAEMLFTGKIVKVEKLESSTIPPGTYFVTFKVETTWKGKPADETRVLWRSTSFLDCGDIPVGEVGEDYLVYAEPSRSTTRDRSLEVTVFSRTSRLPANRKSEIYLIDDWGKQPRLSQKPELNRADASNDVELLRVLRACGCFPTMDALSREVTRVTTCQSCLQWRLKPF